MATAILTLQLQGVQELLNHLRNIDAQIRGMNVGSGQVAPGVAGTPGVSQGMANAAQGAMPAQPSVGPQNASVAAATAGTPNAGIPGQPKVNPSDPGALPPPGVAPGFGLREMGAALGGMQAYNQSMALLKDSMGGYSRSVAQGSFYDVRSAIPGAVGMTATAIGAAIGGLAGGGVFSIPGAGIGALVGGGVGSIAQSTIQPFIDRDIALSRMNRLYSGSGMGTVGGMPQNVIDSGFNAAMSGRPFTPRALESMGGKDERGVFGLLEPFEGFALPGWATGLAGSVPGLGTAIQGLSILGNASKMAKSKLTTSGFFKKEFADAGADALNSLRYSDSMIRAFGGISKVETDQDKLALIHKAIQVDPQAAASLAMMMKGKGGADVLSQANTQIERQSMLRGAMGISEAGLGLMSVQFQNATKYGGSAGAKSMMGGLESAMGGHASIIEQMAAIEGDPAKKAQLMAQAQIAREQSKYVAKEAYFGARSQEIGAESALGLGRAGRTMEEMLYGGKSSSDMPWDRVSGAYNKSAENLSSLMREKERAGMLSPAEKDMMTEQIEDLRFKAGFGVNRQREQMRNSETMARAGLESSKMFASSAHSLLFGSASEQAGGADLELKALEQKKKALQEILQTSKYLTYEQKLQLETSLQDLKVAEERAKKASILAKAGAAEFSVGTEASQMRSRAQIALIRGAGGKEGSAALMEDYSASLKEVGAAQQYRASLIRDGFSPDSMEVQEADRRIAGGKVQSELSKLALAVSPLSAQDRTERSNQNTMLEFYSRGYGGSQGAIRSTLQKGIESRKSRISELDRNRSEQKGKGLWTDEMEAKYTEERNSEALQALDMEVAYDEGWDQRIISEAYNMPGQGRLFSSRYTRMEASRHGIVNRAFGGTEQQTREMRNRPARFMQVLDGGSPQGLGDRAMAQSETTINLNVTVKDGGGQIIGESNHRIEGGKSAAPFIENSEAKKRPPG